MLRDWCTWDDDYKELVQEVRTKLIRLATDKTDRYTCVLMQGSGTFAVESIIGTALPDNGKLLVLPNGAYGDRIVADRQDLEDQLRLQRQRGAGTARSGKAGGDPEGGPGDHPCRRRPLRDDDRHAQPHRGDRQDRQEVRKDLHRRRDEQLRRHPHRHRRRWTSISSSAAPTNASRGSPVSASSSPRKRPC